MFKSKRYKAAEALIDPGKRYEMEEAVELIKKFPATKFDQTVELHFNLGVDPRKAEQQIRNSVVLPHGTGKTMRVLVFAEGDKADEAKAAGADYVGVEDLMDKIQKENWFDFDVVIATPNLMGRIGRLGRVLGPRGLMPNPKVGTVTNDVATAVSDSKGGKVTYRVDKFGNLHIPAGKISFETLKLKDNLYTLVSAVLRDRPPTLKGNYIRSMTVTATMCPGLKLNVAAVTLQAKK